MGNDNLVEKKFAEIFRNKGNVGPLSEKAQRNFEIIKMNPVSIIDRVHYFCVGHAFKNIDKSVFCFKLDTEKETLLPTQFELVFKDCFTFNESLSKIIKNIRNLNSHYVHTFDELMVNNYDFKVISFLKQAFELSVLITYLNEKEISYATFLEKKDSSLLTKSLCDKFFPNKEHQKEEREIFLKLNIQDAIDSLLFIEVKEDIEWKIYNEHKVFDIKPGKYFSSNACLFLLSLFLYKDEANQLISKIRGFKRTEDQYSYKRNIFSFFSKKFTSQDINSEEKHLVRFNDIIQYLNHIPTPWNKYLSPELLNPSMTTALERHVIETEIFRSFPTYSNGVEHQAFLLYAVQTLFEDKIGLFNFEKYNLSEKEIRDFEYEINTSPELKDIDEKIKTYKNKNLSKKQTDDLKNLKYKSSKLVNEPNQKKEKLKSRIREEKLLSSYGRNQDRFMDIAILYLAENNYFGAEAQFKLYQFYNTDEQNNFTEKLPQKELDKKKYHQGKLIYFSSYSSHFKRYPHWDTPFVVENNAVQVKININNNEEKLFSIQRKLLLYLLDDALFNSEKPIENGGKRLLEDYYLNHLSVDFEKAKDIISNSDSITDSEKTEFKKLLPRRLLYNYNPSSNKGNKNNPFLNILESAIQQEGRYQLLLANAKRLNLEEEFLAKNKGKQFKLRFVRKMWHLMFFSETYKKRALQYGHHKSFNITKEEFNSFCKWMYSFEEVPEYKQYLERLFESKHFFENNTFKRLFKKAPSLDFLYEGTKILAEEWIQNKDFESLNSSSYKLDNYLENKTLDKVVVYINISHFISYLELKNKLERDSNQHIKFKALENSHFLNQEYYYKSKLTKEEYKSNGKLFNKLKTQKLEDCLLYELAMKYLYIDESVIKIPKDNVAKILKSKLSIKIKDKNKKHLYNLIVPFNKIVSLAVLIKHKNEQEVEYNDDSFLAKISIYLANPGSEKDIKLIAKDFNSKGKVLNYEDLHKINNHITSTSLMISKVVMGLEQYFIFDNRTFIPEGKNHINIKDIGNHKIHESYFKNNIRNKAFHFSVPVNGGYKSAIAKIEQKFIKEEIKSKNYTSYESMAPEHKMMARLFIQLIHDNLCKRPRVKNVRDSNTEGGNYKKYFDHILSIIDNEL